MSFRNDDDWFSLAFSDFSSFRIERTMLAFEIYVTQHLIDYNPAEVIGIEKG